MGLFALAPPLVCLVRPPGAALFLVLRHLDAVRLAPALPLALRGALGGWLRRGVLLEHGLQALEQAAFIGIAECELHLPAPEQPPPEQLQPCRLPVPSHPSCPCAAVRADPRRGQQRAGWQQGGMGWADAVGGKGRLIFLSPHATNTHWLSW
jgi:hypothetical protein